MRPEALLFDMDGTLTEPMLDFPAIKAEMGIVGRPILEALAEMPAAERERAEAILHRHEDLAAEQSTLNAGCVELLQWVEAQRLPLAVITRNRLKSARTVFDKHGITIDVLITREVGRFKPDPHPLLQACERLKVDASRSWMIGDGQYDVEAGLAAACRTVWISHGRARPFAAEPWRTVQDLNELHHLLRRYL